MRVEHDVGERISINRPMPAIQFRSISIFMCLSVLFIF